MTFYRIGFFFAIFRAYFRSSSNRIANGNPCSRTTSFRNIVTAVVRLSPRASSTCVASSFNSGSIRMLVTGVFAMARPFVVPPL